jgi:Ca-activated chloride channel family protein
MNKRTAGNSPACPTPCLCPVRPQCLAVIILSCERGNRAGLDGVDFMGDMRTFSSATAVDSSVAHSVKVAAIKSEIDIQDTAKITALGGRTQREVGGAVDRVLYPQQTRRVSILRLPQMVRHLIALAAAALLLAGCGGSHPTFHILASTEQKTFQPIIQDYCEQKQVACVFNYEGSLDIGLTLSGEEVTGADAVWLASSVWIDIYDLHHRVKNLKSIASTPVILGVRMSKARELGWIGKPVHMDDILAAVNAKRLSFLMTSATQSNSGASAYLAMLAASFGKPDRLDPRALDDADARAKVKALLTGVARSAGSSGWLKDLYLATSVSEHPFDGMWNYEAVLKETNDSLRAQNSELLYAVYPADGTTFANAPMGYVDRGQSADIKSFFDGLQAYLLSPDVQAKIAASGRRTAPGMARPAPPEPDWNFDPSRIVHAIALPAPSVIARALTLYQEALRKPSLTAICLDFSGSMRGYGETQLKAAMSSLLDPGQASHNLIQWTPADRIVVLPFDSHVREVDSSNGSIAAQADLLTKVRAQSADDGNDMYACAERALSAIQPYLVTDQFLPAIVIMTDGRSDPHKGFEDNWRKEGHELPIFGVTFGNAQATQLDELATLTRARVFDGNADLAEAFRSLRGYN